MLENLARKSIEGKDNRQLGEKGDKESKSAKRKSLDEKGESNQILMRSMVKILKKALIQPDYKKSNLLITYFDCLSIRSFSNIAGSNPNYIKLTCFKLKSIYVEEQKKINYYYLFELQEREARTRMHKFIIGDNEIMKLIETKGLEWTDESLTLKSDKNK